MNRPNLYLLVAVTLGFALLLAPQFVLSVMIGAAAIVYGSRSFIRAAQRRRRR